MPQTVRIRPTIDKGQYLILNVVKPETRFHTPLEHLIAVIHEDSLMDILGDEVEQATRELTHVKIDFIDVEVSAKVVERGK